MANWFTNQKAKRLLGDMPLTEDMTGSGGSHMTSKGGGSPLHQEKDKYGRNIPGTNYFSKGTVGDKFLGPLLGGTANYSDGIRSNSQGGGSEIDSKNFSGDSNTSPGANFIDYFKKKKTPKGESELSPKKKPQYGR